MEIFYLKKSEFLKSVNRESLETFSDGKIYASEEKYLEHLCGLFITKFVAKCFYKLENTDIVVKDKKPYFVSGNLFFSISHSKDIVLVAFNNNDIGADVEYVCEKRDFKSIMNRYGEIAENPTAMEFYRFWTLHESEIKLGADIKSLFSTSLEKDYILTCVSNDVLIGSFNIKKLGCVGVDIDVCQEFEFSQKFEFIPSVE